MRAKKTIVVAPQSETEATELAKEFALNTSKLKTIEGKMEESIQRVRDKYANDIERLKAAKECAFDKLHAYAETNREDLFSKKKSRDLTFSVIGFRTGTPKVNKGRGLTWPKILKSMKDKGLSLLRVKEEIDKDKIITMRNDEALMKVLKDEYDIEVVQDETFFIEPKEEQIAV